MSSDAYGALGQTRTAVVAGVWNAIVVGSGNQDTLIAMEDSTVTWRVTFDATIPLGAGTFIPASGAYQIERTSAAAVTVYVNPSAGTTAILQASRAT
jgi:hypothetical protein